jgi:PAS domain S-box-containing protein
MSFDASRTQLSKLRYDITRLNLESDKLMNHFNTISAGSAEGASNDKIDEICISINSGLNNLSSGKLISGDLVFERNIKEASDNVKEIERLTREFVGLFYERGDLSVGLINQWYSLYLSLKEVRRGPTTGRAGIFFDKVSEFSMNYMLNRDPDELEKLIDYWQFEKKIAFPANSTSFETETVLTDFYENTRSLSAIYRKSGWFSGKGLQGEIRFYFLQLDQVTQNLEEESSLQYSDFSKKLTSRFIWFIFIFGGLAIAVVYSSLGITLNSVSKLKNFLNELKSGKVPDKLVLKSSDDLNEMAESLNEYVESLNRKISFADKIGEAKIQSDFEPEGEEDVLGNSLLKMAKRLRDAENEESIHKSEEKKRTWLSEGMAGFGEIFRSERENLEELAFKVIKNLVKYIDANQGAIYLNNTEDGTPVIDMVAAFAYDRRKYLNRRIHYGEGLIGTCALEKETIYLTEIPEDFLEITSGLGQAQPRCLLIVPLKLENELFGIIEIASFRELQSHETGFVEQLGESIATTLAAVRINEQTVRLLEKSQKQAEEMARQEEKMRKNMQELQDAQEESRRKETEITGILNAVNSSSLVAEFSTNGRFADVNEKFLFLFESPRDQVIGKHHSDFAVLDKYSNEYKEFWKRLKDGETINQTEQFRLSNGNELWLNQTYTPILDRNGKPYKILNIALDITQSKKQQESLENQAHEIIKRGIEMETLSKAVDESIIKCELSSDGIILDINENYLETTGYSRKEILGKNLRLFLKDAEKQQFEKVWSEVTKEKTYTGVIRRTKPTGEEVWLMSTFSPVKNEDGDIYKIYFLAHDITEKKLKYQLLEDANKEIERLKQHLHQQENL